jgi:hypothetical protein
MGNSQSSTGGGTDVPIATAQLDYYALLNVDEEAGDDEIKVRPRLEHESRKLL